MSSLHPRAGRARPYLWLIRLLGVIVPQRLRADWRQEWEAELRYREALLAEWDNLTLRRKLDLMRRSMGAFWDALWLQPERLEDEMFQDLRLGWRMLLRSPVMSLVAVLSLGLGIGATTTIFSVVNALLLRPLPYQAPEQLVKVFQARPDPAKGSLPSMWSYPRFEVLRDQSRSFASVAGFSKNAYNLTGTDAAERLQVEMVSPGYFALLGVEPVVGRTFSSEEDGIPEANLSALLSYGLWQRRFGGDTQVIGKTLEVDKHPFLVVGVVPPGFRGQDGTADAWVTMSAAPLLRYKAVLTRANNYWFQVLARLKDGVTMAQARLDMEAVSGQIERMYPSPKQTLEGNSKVPSIAPLQAAKVDPAIRKSFLILLAAVGLVLLIACANTANLLLARAVARRREFALRTALGAGRLRLIRQLVTESMLLALIGGALGLLIARWGLELVKSFRPGDNTQFWTSYSSAFDFFTIDLDWRVLSFNFGVAILTGMLFGLLPAIRSSHTSVAATLKEATGGAGLGFSAGRMNARSLLVVAEMALSLVLMTGAGLMIKSLIRLNSVDLGFSPENVLTMSLPSRNAKPGFYDQVLSRVRVLPGIESAGLGSTAPLLGYSSKTVMDIEGRPDVGQVGVGLHSVSPDYFTTLRIELLEGRAFSERDRIGAPRVAVINQAAAEKFFPGEEPLGRRLRPYIDPEYDTAEKSVEIVGVVANARYGRPEAESEPDIYLSSLQPTDPAPTLIVRTNGDPATITAEIRSEVLALDRDVPLTAVQTMNHRAAEVTSRTRFITLLLGLFAGVALLLSAIGIYGVTAYSVSARTREIGIRMALGAQRRDVLRMVLREGATLIAAGLAAGLLAAWISLRLLESQLFEISTTDPLTAALVAVLLAGVALLACGAPARRATRTDPMTALRYE
jgi:putative ABC transport system permease protein